MSLKKLIKVADYYNVKYGFGKVAGDFKLKEFSVDPRNEWKDVWGGGHTTETDPINNGWRCRPVRGGEKLAIIGQNRTPGCASVRAYSDKYDVAFYDKTPKEVEEGILNNNVPDAYFKQYGKTPGWGLYVIDEIKRMRNNMRDDEYPGDDERQDYLEGVKSGRLDDDDFDAYM